MKPRRRVQLERHTIRVLTDDQLARTGGGTVGGTSNVCTFGCPTGNLGSILPTLCVIRPEAPIAPSGGDWEP